MLAGFKKGFSLGYQGPWECRDNAAIIPLNKEDGDEIDLWEKMAKEVKANRFAGPFDKIPYDCYVQLPVGLVPKARGQSHLIFHLSYNFKGGGLSINHYILQEICTIKYNDLDHAVKSCLILFGIVNVKSAFHLIPLSEKYWKLLVMKARSPMTGQWKYFIDKCLPFGASISCAIFQCFSNALAHILRSKVNHILDKEISNYLDDFLNMALMEQECNGMLTIFTQLCNEIGVPLAIEKTIWATCPIVFLGILLDGVYKILALPVDKIERATYLLKLFLAKKKKLAGLLNFFHWAIYPGRAFTRRMYARIPPSSGEGSLKPYHHIYLDNEFRQDCKMRLLFLTESTDSVKYCRPFTNLAVTMEASELGFHTDSSANGRLGFGGICGSQWFAQQWEVNYIHEFKPSIGYLELYTVCIGLYIWSEKIRDKRLIIHCDNMSVVQMVNNTTSGCKRCMHLVRLIVLWGLRFNFRIVARYISTKANDLADSLSRLQMDHFWKVTRNYHFKQVPEPMLEELWPASKI